MSMQLETLDAPVREYIRKIETDIVKIKSDYEQRTKELKESEYKYLELKERYDLLLHKRFCRSAEQMLADSRQPLLFTAEEPEAPEEPKVEAVTEIKSYRRKKAGRKPLGDNLVREIKVIDIAEADKICACGAKLTKIGEETSEKLQIIPPRIYVEKTVRPKWACRCCEGTADEEGPAVRMAQVEPSIIPRGIASPSLLSTIITQKFELHLPYYRQERQFGQIGVRISRQDMSNWQQQVFKNLSPLFDLMKTAVKSGPLIQMDETPVQVMGEPDRADTQKSYIWLARGGPPGRPVLWYEYHETRAASHAKTFLAGYSGYLQTDGYDSYDCAVKDMPGIMHVGCFAHVRRKFFEAAQANKKSLSAEEGIKHIRNLYTIENKLRAENLTDALFLSKRKTQAKPVLDTFRAWLLKRADEVPPSLLLGKAIHYSLSQWDKLVMYLESPHLTPDNNACENGIRPFVVGRKNWLFCQSPKGADSSCGMYSLIETAKHNGLVPFKYLMAVFEKAPYAVSSNDWKNLLPWNILPLI